MHQLEKIYRRRIPGHEIITAEIGRYIAELSFDLKRQIGILITRRGEIAYVVVGTYKDIILPSLIDYRLGRNRLRGLRFIHTHLKSEPISQEDLTELALLRLDLTGVLMVGDAGLPKELLLAHLLPFKRDGQVYELLPAEDLYHPSLDFETLITDLEREMVRSEKDSHLVTTGDRAILVGVHDRHGGSTEESLEELKELARTSTVQVLDTMIQQVDSINPQYVVGKGKLKELIILSLQLGASLLVFDCELNPAQVRSLSETTEMKVLDRTQLILDIFARHAHTPDGKIQVELAQLRYILPRLKIQENSAFSRLAGGIGGRGPGEQKLEIDRRHVRERISHLEKKLEAVKKSRKQRRMKRSQSSLPIISIVGYTNVGKSTLLNTLTNSQVLVEDLFFATLDTSSRRLRFPHEREVIITDTVGFIRSLPEALLGAFRSTLEELEDAHLLLHVIDISHPSFPEQIEAVQKILQELNLTHIPVLQVFNKIDKISSDLLSSYKKGYQGVFICAQSTDTLQPLIFEMGKILEDHGCFYSCDHWSSYCQGRI